MRRSKGSRRIVVHDVEYRWRATGNDGYILVGIWPVNNIGPFIMGTFGYHETWIPTDPGWTSAGDQIVITNRLIQRIIQHAITQHGYDPNLKGAMLNLQVLDDCIPWEDAIRASEDPK